MMNNAWIVDIDGTLALRGERDPYDETRVSEDKPNWPVLDVVDALKNVGNSIIIVSGRSTFCSHDTMEWLYNWLIPFDALHMRAYGDNRKDALVKQEILEAVKDRWNIVGVIDDRQQTVDMWRANGLVTLQVAEGNF